MKVTWLEKAIAEKGIFERFQIKGLYGNISDDGISVPLHTAIFRNITGQFEITIFDLY